jgi:CRISPR-associated exonuclease Cas4
MPDPQDDFLPIRSLNDLLFCERRCALHRIEQLWEDNAFTVEGLHGHQRADRRLTETAPGVRAVHAVLLRSNRLRLTGKADVIEFHRQPDQTEVPYPVEYKRGRRRRWDNDDVQLCAQALCLEEMLGVAVPAGAIFHNKSKRRRETVFTPELRRRTEDAARRLHELVAAGVTPPPVLKPRCRGCSLHDRCMPELLCRPDAVRRYHQALFVLSSLP